METLSVRLCMDSKNPRLHQKVLDLAGQKLNAFPYAQLPEFWLHTHAQASLLVAQSTSDPVARLKLLDRAILIAGDSIPIQTRCQIDSLIDEICSETPNSKHIKCLTPDPKPVPVLHSQSYAPHTELSRDMDLQEKVQSMLDRNRSVPYFLPELVAHWPACHKWHDLAHLVWQMGLSRHVPVEVGRSYTDPSWSQQYIPLSNFYDSLVSLADTACVVLEPDPLAEGASIPRVMNTSCHYLAQYNLFTQFPQLAKDISVPELVYLDPQAEHSPPKDSPAINAWMGPAGTISPLHCDPYHNLFCQVVGYKYWRLYPPETSVYPCGPHQGGVDMSNTSSISLEAMDATFRDRFPRFSWSSGFHECILGPGDSLFVPRGWWHYVVSLSSSMSVSFWF